MRIIVIDAFLSGFCSQSSAGTIAAWGNTLPNKK
jgi:hypothetical protein